MKPSFALAIPHTPWVQARRESIERLADGLGITRALRARRRGHPIAGLGPEVISWFSLFEEREPNWAWSKKLWAWGAIACDGGATHLLQLQDDVIVAPNFWAIVSAMVTAVPDKIIGLQGAHPAHRLHATEGLPWAQSRAWMVGVGYVIPAAILRDLVSYREALPPEFARSVNEDDLIARYAAYNGHMIWHPVPTPIDHDTEIESTYNNDQHMHRRPTVTWRHGYGPELEDAAYWTPKADPPLVQNPHLNTCWCCQAEPGLVAFHPTGVRVGRACVSKAAAIYLGQQTEGAVGGGVPQ